MQASGAQPDLGFGHQAYIATDEGWLYLASVMDLYSRKIIGFHMDSRMTKELVIQLE
ncbi:DDE-type integrase/transposase/recombinase [Paenibacillus rhizophilus]